MKEVRASGDVQVRGKTSLVKKKCERKKMVLGISVLLTFTLMLTSLTF